MEKKEQTAMNREAEAISPEIMEMVSGGASRESGFVCKKCSARFSSLREVAHHISTVHGSESKKA